jgi:hypothetical protein
LSAGKKYFAASKNSATFVAKKLALRGFAQLKITTPVVQPIGTADGLFFT